MNDSDITRQYTETTCDIQAGRLVAALDRISSMARTAGVPELAERADALRQTYDYMLSYFAGGNADPGRHQLYDDLLTSTRMLADRLLRYQRTPDGIQLYYNKLRMSQRRPGAPSISAMVGAQAGDADMASDALFDAVWTTFPLEKSDVNALVAAIEGDVEMPGHDVEHLIEAIALGLLDFYDPARIDLLVRGAASKQAGVAAASMIGIVTALHRYRLRRHPRSVVAALSSLFDEPRQARRADTVMLEYARAASTMSLADRLQRDVLPDMMRIGREMADRMRQRRSDDDNLPAETPDLSELLEDEVFTNRLKDINERMAEGDDVYFSTFRHMKLLPWWSEASHWFKPFVVPQSSDGDLSSQLLARLGALPMLCDSDKYSIQQAIDGMSHAQRDLAMSQFLPSDPDMAEAMKSELVVEGGESFETAVNRIIKNHFRFYHLFRRKSDFFNPFAEAINPLDMKVISNHADLGAIAAAMFRNQLYADALKLYNVIDASDGPEAARYRVMGYCEEKAGRTEAAIDYYTRADLLEEGNRWTLRRLSRLLAGRSHLSPQAAKNAVAVLARLLADSPDDVDTMVAYGSALAAAGSADDALMQLFDAERKATDKPKVWRAIGRTLLMTGDADTAADYFERTVGTSAESDDYAWLALADMLRGDMRNAVNNVMLSNFSADPAAFVTFTETIGSRYRAINISRDDLALLADVVRLRNR